MVRGCTSVTFGSLALASGLLCVGTVFGFEPGGSVRSTESSISAALSDRLEIQGATPQPGPKDTDADLRYVIGDRLKIGIFEQLEANRTGNGAGNIRPLVERTELSGEYVVQLSGEVFLPIIGAIKVTHRTAGDAQKVLLESAKAAIGGNLIVSITVTEREPIYVVGTHPGAYRYTPGMILAQALALAGDHLATGDLWKQVDITREQERMRKSAERLKRQLALLDVLDAEQRNATPTTSHRLVELAGPNAADLVRAASEARALERERQRSQVIALDGLIRTARAEIEASRKRLDYLATIVMERKKHHDALVGRVGRGFSTENLLVMARNEVVEIESSWHELRATVMRSESRVLELERERDMTLLASRIDFEHQLRSARHAITDEEVLMSTLGKLLHNVGAEVSAASETPREPAYVIIRRGPRGPEEFAAGFLTRLDPGDVVRMVK
jgi:protein involved in polysaccharide export with SLBB domain